MEDIENYFVTPLTRGALTCPVSCEIFSEPTILPNCGHTFSLSCIRQLNNHICPLCRVAFDPDTLIPNRALADTINELPMKCKYAARGCGKIVRYGDWFAHLANCAYKDPADEGVDMYQLFNRRISGPAASNPQAHDRIQMYIIVGMTLASLIFVTTAPSPFDSLISVLSDIFHLIYTIFLLLMPVFRTAVAICTILWCILDGLCSVMDIFIVALCRIAYALLLSLIEFAKLTVLSTWGIGKNFLMIVYVLAITLPVTLFDLVSACVLILFHAAAILSWMALLACLLAAVLFVFRREKFDELSGAISPLVDKTAAAFQTTSAHALNAIDSVHMATVRVRHYELGDQVISGMRFAVALFARVKRNPRARDILYCCLAVVYLCHLVVWWRTWYWWYLAEQENTQRITEESDMCELEMTPVDECMEDPMLA